METRRLIGIFILLSMLCIVACGLNSSQGLDPEGKISFNEVVKIKQSSRCADNKNICATVSIRYPEAVEGDMFVMQEINNFVNSKILESIAVFSEQDQHLLPDIDAAMYAFIQLYDEFITTSDFFTVPWELKINGKVTFQSNKVISISLQNESYTGGAHPNAYTHLLNFDAETGQLIHLSDIVTSTRSLRQLLEKKRSGDSRVSQSNEPSIALASDTYINLPEHFAVKRDGVLFFYNPYEIGSYADGSYSFFLTFDQLENVLKSDVLFEE